MSMMTTPMVALPETLGAPFTRVSLAKKLSLAMQMATVTHHSWHRAGRADASMQTVTYTDAATWKFAKILESLNTMIHFLSPLTDLAEQMENIELLAVEAAKRAMMSTLLDPREAVSWKRRKVISMPRIMEEEPVLDWEQR